MFIPTDQKNALHEHVLIMQKRILNKQKTYNRVLLRFCFYFHKLSGCLVQQQFTMPLST